jgi:hypothetical protein
MYTDQINAFLVLNLTHSRSFVQLNDNRFVDVPACVLGSTQITDLNVSLVLFLCFFRCRC